ncbi:MAG TPA: hypothetical protein VD997_04065 [Phycisphaerales bacterium]|nr:hypothetical protein [Phycisphaerales bacterium]
MPLRLESAFLSFIALAAAGIGCALLATGDEAAPAYQGRVNPTFVNFETPHCHPLELTPDGQRLLAVNTADNSLEVFQIVSGSLVSLGSVPVGLDPVTVRCRANGEAWVVNNISDSVSIVDVGAMRVTRTLKTGDEPFDVVFAGTPERAFVSCSMIDAVQVFDPANPGVAPVTVVIDAQRPRSLAVSPDGQTVYAAIFESGNGTTILGGGAGTTGNVLQFPPNVVGDSTGPYGGVNPPPNSGNAFVPARTPGNPAAPAVGLIVRKNAAGQWMDDNNRNWTGLVSGPQASRSGRPVGWDLPDRDLAAISTSTLSVSYATTLMNICMSVGVNPATGVVTVVGTEATNHVRFEPNVNGTFVRVNMASVNAANLGQKTIVDLNPHLTYAGSTLPTQGERDRAIGDPRAIVWNSAGTKAYVSGMGSNNVVVVNAAGARAGGSPATQTIEVGEGPTGIALDEARGRMYVLNRFDASISVVGLADEVEGARVPFFDPTPAAIKLGRKHLYDTHKNSGLGQASCASCHIDSKMDRLAWDLGDPSGTVAPLVDLNQGFGVPALAPGTGAPAYSAFHPMKGPMTTQTLQHIIGLEPLHWRADRAGLENFNGAFMGLQGDDQMLTPQEMQQFEEFLATIYFPPNPFRNFDNSLPTSLPLPGHFATGRYAGSGGLAAGTPLPNGNAQNGLAMYRSTNRRLDGNTFACATCHTLPTGAGPDHRRNNSTGAWDAISPGSMGQRHIGVVSVDGSTQTTIKVAQLRNVYKKTGFNATKTSNNAGFGYLHDGSVDSIERFVNEPVFTLANDQETADMVAFMLAFAGSDFAAPGPLEPPGPLSNDVPASVGVQTTLINPGAPEAGQLTLISSMIAQANTGKVGLVAKAQVNGRNRGYRYNGGGVWQSDHAGETLTSAQVQALAGVTYTVVPKNSETRIGIDRDLDGVLNFDEEPLPPLCGTADFNGDGDTGTDQDIEAFFACLGGTCCPLCGTADFNFDGDTGTDQDIEAFFRVLGGGSC